MVVAVGRGLSSRKSSRPSLPGLAESCDVDDEASAVFDDDVAESGRGFFEVSVGFFLFSWTCWPFEATLTQLPWSSLEAEAASSMLTGVGSLVVAVFVISLAGSTSGSLKSEMSLYVFLEMILFEKES